MLNNFSHLFPQTKMSQPIARGYGKVSAGNNAPDVTADTAFHLASVSKVFAASAIASLLDRQLIDLDQSVCNVLPASYARSACTNPQFPNTDVTWRMFATHRTSLNRTIPLAMDANGNYVDASYGSESRQYGGEPVGNYQCPIEDVTGFYRDLLIDKETETTVGSDAGPINWYDLSQASGGTWLEFAPGSEEFYSNLAYGYIAALVEHATGMTFPQYTNQFLFNPLRMDRTRWFRRDLPPDTAVAMPVDFRFGNQNFVDLGHYCYVDYSSGQLHSTANDMRLWLLSMLDLGAPTLWSASTGNTVFSCQERNLRGVPPAVCSLGLGWILLDNSMKGSLAAEQLEFLAPYTQHDWTNGAYHDGSELGVQSLMVVLPEARVFAMGVTNTDGDRAMEDLVSAIANFPLPEIQETPVTPAPVTPAPVTPAPVTPAPGTPAPVTPAPVTPAPVTPAPVTPAPVTPAPVPTAPVTPAPVPTAPVTPAPVTTPMPTLSMPTTSQGNDKVMFVGQQPKIRDKFLPRPFEP